MGPFAAYSIIWATVTLLHAPQIFFFYSPFSVKASIMISIVAIAGWVISKLVIPAQAKLDEEERELRLARAEVFRDRAGLVAAAIFLLEVAVFGGVPLQWMLAGDGRGYADFGVPTLHGIFNAILMFVTSSSGIFALVSPRRGKNFVICLVGFFVMVILFSRAMIVITLIQIGGILLFSLKKRFTFTRGIAAIAATIVGLYAFGVVGNIRHEHHVLNSAQDQSIGTWAPPTHASEPVTNDVGMVRLINVGYNPFIGMLSMNKAFIFKLIPTEFLWSFAYITSGYNNLVANLEYIDPSYVPSSTFSKLVPSIIYMVLDLEKEPDGFERAHPAFTVSTAFAGPVSDFGYLGMLLAIPLLVAASAAYQGVGAGKPSSILLYAMLFQSILLTPYVDTILYTTFVLQMALAWLSDKKLIRI